MANVAFSDAQQPVPTTECEKTDARTTLKERIKRFSDWLGLHDTSSAQAIEQASRQEQEPKTDIQRRPSLARRWSKKVVPGLPRAPTFKRRLSEQRERLTPHEPSRVGPKAFSLDRRRAFSCAEPHRLQSPPPPALLPDTKEEVQSPVEIGADEVFVGDEQPQPGPDRIELDVDEVRPLFSPPLSDTEFFSDVDDALIEEELERKWILNLSMHFRDRSDREKFFVTYAETPTRWRRLTLSCDYREAPPDSLERDLKALRYQREKSARIYEAIRESLSDIQYFDTVTNLKLQTSDGRLHVHVTEDLNEIIPFPPASAVSHLGCPMHKESSLQFESHLSGFVYKVTIEGQVFIKKEIPGPDVVDEFLYEINALHSLRDSQSVIKFGGVVVDDEEKVVKGLLIKYAERGPLIDILYDEKGRLPWTRREKWARQIVQGLSEIHEAGFVQGDFTLSNIVIDDQDDAKIIDINRRGCPVGWEPPEVRPLIRNNQKISMYIGIKSDVFQLGMVLWALAMENDEPDMQPRPLSFAGNNCDAPFYFQDLVSVCLSERPQDRVTAKELVTRFPDIEDLQILPLQPRREAAFVSSETQYIDPATAVEREDLDRFREPSSTRPFSCPDLSTQTRMNTEHTYPKSYPSSETGYNGLSDYMVPRGRRGAHRDDTVTTVPDTPDLDSAAGPFTDSESRHRDADSYDIVTEPQIISVSPTDEKRWDEIMLDGHPYLIDRRSLELWKQNGIEDAKPVEAVH